MFERFTDPARDAVIRAQTEARALGHDRIDTEHLLLGVLARHDSVGGQVLASFGVTHEAVAAAIASSVGHRGEVVNADALSTIGIDLDKVRRCAEDAFGRGALQRTRASHRRLRGHLPLSTRAKKALERSLRESLDLRHRHIGTEHILLGLLREAGSLAALILARHGVTHSAARSAVLTHPQSA